MNVFVYVRQNLNTKDSLMRCRALLLADAAASFSPDDANRVHRRRRRRRRQILIKARAMHSAQKNL